MQTTVQSKPARVQSEAKLPARGPALLDTSVLRHVVGGMGGTALTTAAQKAATTDAPRSRWA
jgi:hypothetical protein